ncbi:hypothetical protein GOP47_0007772 [Adiantum capillus-veneris]|uniref:Uncharacterized protein n=1 Tax=Adiantum capillus-veneris TaxID=13818 RepID=A0A9D4ZJJ4_ADICA|nr:hypothetical protein GOP47_0007772 [Adiantum capillus-veneris]
MAASARARRPSGLLVALAVMSFCGLMGDAQGLSMQFSRPAPDEADSFPSPEELSSLFLAWLDKNPRPYADDTSSRSFEKLRRFAVFTDNFRHIFEHNKGSGGGSYWLGLNSFADLTHEEFKAAYLWSSSSLSGRRSRRHHDRTDEDGGDDGGRKDEDNIPAAIDWRERGAVTNVKNQGQCGSCWAFSTVVAVEGIHQISRGELVPLSEQQLVDCNTDNKGCNGGSMPIAFDFLVNNGGLDTEEHYPYRAAQGDCPAPSSLQNMVSIDGYMEVPANDEQALLRAVARQPVSVGIDASHRDFQFYAGGVYDGRCNSELDHGVAIVGFGSDSETGADYWIVKNSWGPDWGDQGYVNIRRGTSDPEGKCGINTFASYPTIQRGSASTQKLK